MYIQREAYKCFMAHAFIFLTCLINELALFLVNGLNHAMEAVIAVTIRTSKMGFRPKMGFVFRIVHHFIFALNAYKFIGFRSGKIKHLKFGKMFVRFQK